MFRIRLKIFFIRKSIFYLLLISFLLGFSNYDSVGQTKRVPVIYETDMCLDVDDVGALAVLHGLQNEGKVNLSGVCYNEVHPLAPNVIDAINTWYNRGDIPIGIYMNYDKAFKDPAPSDYFTHDRYFDVDNMPHPKMINKLKMK